MDSSTRLLTGIPSPGQTAARHNHDQPDPAGRSCCPPPGPHPLGTEDDRELLTWIDGESGSAGWAKIVPESGLRAWAAFLRRYHDAVAGYRPPVGSLWSSGHGTCAPGEILCHGDFGPWNGVWRADRIVGLIDFDHARPAPPIFDIAYALEYAAPLRDDSECLRWLRYPQPPDRRRRIEIFCDAYSIPVPADITERIAWSCRPARRWPT